MSDPLRQSWFWRGQRPMPPPCPHIRSGKLTCAASHTDRCTPTCNHFRGRESDAK